MRYLYKRLQTVIATNRNFWNTIVIVITLDSLYKDFNTTIVSLLETEDKTIDQVQSLLQSKKAKNLSKQVIRNTGDLVILFKDKNRDAPSKKKANSNNKCFNGHKLR